MDFSKEEYRTLVEAMQLANWVLHAYAEEERKETKNFRELEQKILSFSKDYGMEKDVHYDKRLEEYLPSRELEEGALTYVDDYNNDTFWDELMERLVMRDLIAQIGEDGLEALSFEQRIEKEEPIRLKYEDEFEKYGISRLDVCS